MPRGRGGKYFGPPLPYIQQVFFSICVPLHVVPTSSPPRARRQRFRAQSPFDLQLNTAARRNERAIGASEDQAPNEREVNDDDGVVSDNSLPSPDRVANLDRRYGTREDFERLSERRSQPLSHDCEPEELGKPAEIKEKYSKVKMYFQILMILPMRARKWLLPAKSQKSRSKGGPGAK